MPLIRNLARFSQAIASGGARATEQWERILGEVTGGVATASKLMVLGATKNLDTLDIADAGLKLAATPIVATAAELNAVADESARIVNIADNSSGLVLTQAAHSNKIITMNDADGGAVTLPEAIGSGMKFTIVIGTTLTTSLVITTADTTNAGYIGHMMMEDADGNFTRTFLTTKTNDLLTLNGGTTGGVAGTIVRLTDVGADVWMAEVIAGNENNAPATCFSST